VPSPERADADFGSRMRRAREARGVSLRQIAETTKLSMAALEALERNDISRLPGGIFSRAFVRSYASEIGVDPEISVREFMTSFPHDSVTAGSPHVRTIVDFSPADVRRRAGLIAMACVLVLLLASAAIYFLPGR
jgi:cytoskeleton protein RodZ